VILAGWPLSHPAAQAEVGTRVLPDLVPDVGGTWLDYVWLDFHDGVYTYGPAVLSFDLLTKAVGVPLDLRADDPVAGSPVSQCTAWLAGLACTERSPLAGVRWEGDGLRYRFDDYARYELRALDAGGAVDFSAAGLLSSRAKPADCPFDASEPDGDGLPPPRYPWCTPASAGVSPGRMDVAASGIAGQDVPLDGIGDGRYALVVFLNPDGRLLEESVANNRLVVVVDIVGKNTPFPVVTVVSKTWG
jgi:hypothetical protein